METFGDRRALSGFGCVRRGDERVPVCVCVRRIEVLDSVSLICWGAAVVILSFGGERVRVFGDETKALREGLGDGTLC